MDPGLRDFVRRMLHWGIESGIRTIMWRLPVVIVVVLMIVMIAIVIYFRLY
jgi:hypothetical protein